MRRRWFMTYGDGFRFGFGFAFGTAFAVLLFWFCFLTLGAALPEILRARSEQAQSRNAISDLLNRTAPPRESPDADPARRR